MPAISTPTIPCSTVTPSVPTATTPPASPATTSSSTSAYSHLNAWAYNPPSASAPGTSPGSLDDQSGDSDDMQQYLQEAGQGIDFSASDFANGQDEITKTSNGMSATAVYDPTTQTISGIGLDSAGDGTVATAHGTGAGIHFGQTTEGQLLVRASGIGDNANTATGGFASDGAETYGTSDNHTDDNSSPFSTFATSTSVVGNKRSLSQELGTANGKTTGTTSQPTPQTPPSA